MLVITGSRSLLRHFGRPSTLATLALPRPAPPRPPALLFALSAPPLPPENSSPALSLAALISLYAFTTFSLPSFQNADALLNTQPDLGRLREHLFRVDFRQVRDAYGILANGGAAVEALPLETLAFTFFLAFLVQLVGPDEVLEVEGRG